MKKNYPKNEREKGGYLMLEAAISIFIVGSVLIVFTGVLGNMYRYETKQRDSIIASNLAQGCIEAIRNKRDNDLKNGYTAFYSINSPAIPAAPDPSKFSVSYSITGSGDSRNVSCAVTGPGGISAKVQDTLYAWGDK